MSNVSITKKGGFELDKSSDEYKLFKKTIPKKIGVRASNHFKRGFTTGGGQTNASASGWKKRKDTSSKSRGRNILVKRGTLQRGIRVGVANFKRIIITSGKTTSDYAEIHNKGGVIDHPGGTPYGFKTKRDAKDGKLKFLKKGKGYVVLGETKAHKIPIPKREFIGESDRLTMDIAKIIDRGIMKVFK